MIRVKVPATTANIGPGFDVFGMALDLYNEICIEEIDNGFEVLQDGKRSPIPLNENLVYKTFINILDKYKYIYKGFRINMSQCNIPISRGLGSSASCIVGAITAANVVLGGILTEEDIINEAVKIEGHPDNVMPAIVGGMVISLINENKVVYSKIKVPKNLRMFVMIPDFKISTEEARKVLPNNYSREECVFNISRASMLINCFNSGELDKLRVSIQDKIHHDYRKQLINDLDKIFEACRNYGSLAEFISGSGSTIIALVDEGNKSFYKNMSSYLDKLEDRWETHLLKPDLIGTQVFNE